MSATRRFAAVLLVFLIASFAVGCASGGDSDSSGDAGGGDSVDADMDDGSSRELAVQSVEESAEFEGAVAYDSVGTTSSGGGGNDGQSAAPLPDIGLSVIKTASIGLEIDKDSFRDSVQRAIDAAERNGGFVLSSDIGGDELRSGSLVIRVPASNFEATLASIKDLGKVTSESISGKDVSQEFVDLNARARHFEAQEAVLLDLMSKATTIPDSIRVQGELQRTQLEIERLRGRINFLKDQTSFSTISMNMTEVGVAPPKPKGTLAKAWAQAKETFMDVIAAVVVGAGFVFPVGILAAIAALIFRALWPRFSPRTPRPADSA